MANSDDSKPASDGSLPTSVSASARREWRGENGQRVFLDKKEFDVLDGHDQMFLGENGDWVRLPLLDLPITVLEKRKNSEIWLIFVSLHK